MARRPKSGAFQYPTHRYSLKMMINHFLTLVLFEFDSLQITTKKINTLLGVIFLVELRRIELLSENLSAKGTPSAVCDQHSLIIQFTNKLYNLVASLYLVCSKLYTLMCTAKDDTLYFIRGNTKQGWPPLIRQRKLNYC